MRQKSAHHPLLQIRPRRMHFPETSRTRRSIRDRLLAKGVSKLEIGSCKKFKNPNTGEVATISRICITDIDRAEEVVEIDGRQVNTRLEMTFLLNLLNGYPTESQIREGYPAIDLQSGSIHWNVKDDIIEIIDGNNETVKYIYPEPCYSTDYAQTRSGNKTLKHLDPPLPANPIPETLKIIDLMRQLKIEIADMVRKDCQEFNEDSMEKVISYVSPRIPYAWKDPGIERTLAVWNLHQYHMHSLHPQINLSMTVHTEPSIEYIHGTYGPHLTCSNTIHPQGHALIHSSKSYHEPGLSKFCEVNGSGSDYHVELLFQEIMKMPWPVHKTVGANHLSLKTERIFTFRDQMKDAIQALIRAVFPDTELFQAILQYPDCDHHLFYNFVQEHPYLRDAAIRCPGVIYAAMIAKIHYLGEKRTIQKYHCFPGYNFKEYPENWSLGPIAMTAVLDKEFFYAGPGSFSPKRMFQELLEKKDFTVSDWLQAIYSPDLIRKHSKKKLLALLERVPVTHHKYLYETSPTGRDSGYLNRDEQKIKGTPRFLHCWEVGKMQVARSDENPLYTMLLPDNFLKRSILELPVEKFPQTPLEWILAKYLCIRTRIPSRDGSHPETKEIPGILRYILQQIGFVDTLEPADSPTEPVLMSGLWKAWLGVLREYSPENGPLSHARFSSLMKDIHHHIEELHHVLDEMHEQFHDVLQITHTKEDRNEFRRKIDVFLLEFPAYGKKRQQRILDRWTRYSIYLPNLKDINSTLEKDIEPSWKPLLEEPIHGEQYMVQEITTRRHLTAHGSIMKHCAGNYFDHCMKSHNCKHILEFLDKETKTPVATAEFTQRSGRRLEQGQFLSRYNNAVREPDVWKLYTEAYPVMSKNFTSDWEKSALRHKSEVKETLLKQKGQDMMNHKELMKAQRICTQWRWQLMQKIVLELPDLPSSPEGVADLPDWVPSQTAQSSAEPGRDYQSS